MTDLINKADKTARSGKYKLAGIIGATSLLIAASFGVQAVAESKVYQHAKLYMTSGSAEAATDGTIVKAKWGKHRGDHGSFSEMSDEQIAKKITRAVKHAAIEIDATPEQEQKIIALATALVKNVKPMHGQFHAAGEQMKDLLTAETVDRAAMEKIRSERMAEADRLSKEVVNAAADVADVLTPEQRKVVAERLEQFKEMRGHRRGRWHRG